MVSHFYAIKQEIRPLLALGKLRRVSLLLSQSPPAQSQRSAGTCARRWCPRSGQPAVARCSGGLQCLQGQVLNRTHVIFGFLISSRKGCGILCPRVLMWRRTENQALLIETKATGWLSDLDVSGFHSRSIASTWSGPLRRAATSARRRSLVKDPLTTCTPPGTQVPLDSYCRGNGLQSSTRRLAMQRLVVLVLPFPSRGRPW